MGLLDLHRAARALVAPAHPAAFAPGAHMADPWPGDAGAGRALVHGVLSLGGAHIPLEDAAAPGREAAAWLPHLHGFSWLRDLKALGGPHARRAARALVARWTEAHGRGKGPPGAFLPGVRGARLFAWATHRGSLLAGLDLAPAMATEAARLHRSLAAGPPGVGRVRAAAGLLAAAAVLEGGDRWRARALAALDSALDAQVLPDGGHASRAPGTLLDALAACVEARVALSAAHAAAPPFLAEVITRMGHALRMFLAPDRGLALFHGTGEGAPAHTAAVLAAAGAGPGTRAPSSLPLMGYERATLGRASLLLDVGGTPPPEHADRAHAAPLALAFSYGPERVFTACGAHPLPGPWRDALTATAAHCALTLGHRDSAPYAPPAATREEGAGAVILEAAHEGYVPAFGVVHRRRLYLAGRGCDLRGQEMLTAAAGAGPAQPLPVAVRFHLHPRVSVALIQGGTQALLRVPGGAGWRFTCGGAALGLDNSVYLGTGTAPRKTKQIVLTAALDTKTARIRWALQREVG